MPFVHNFWPPLYTLERKNGASNKNATETKYESVHTYNEGKLSYIRRLKKSLY